MEELDAEMLANIDMLLEMDVLEDEDSWDLLQAEEVSLNELEDMEGEGNE